MKVKYHLMVLPYILQCHVGLAELSVIQVGKRHMSSLTFAAAIFSRNVCAISKAAGRNWAGTNLLRGSINCITVKKSRGFSV